MKTLKGNPTWKQEETIRSIIQAGGNVRLVKVKDTGEARVDFSVGDRLRVWVLDSEGARTV